MARVNEGSHSFTCHPHVYPQVANEPYLIPAFTPQPQSVTALWPELVFRPAEGSRPNGITTQTVQFVFPHPLKARFR